MWAWLFYFVFLFASSMFYPLDPLPRAFRLVAAVNPVTWHVDVLRYATDWRRRDANDRHSKLSVLSCLRW
jgi:ABC-type polysaccharide/polyol phosphate export permease